MKSNSRNLLALAVLLGLSPACAGTTVYVPRTSPAEINLADYERLAVGGVGGEGGGELVADLTQALVETKRFEVLDRQHLGEVLKEQDFNASGRVSDESAVSIGQMFGSAALLVGDVTSYSYGEEVSSAKATCLKDGKQVECVEFARHARAEMSVALKLIDTENGKILAAKNLSATVRQIRREKDQEPPEFAARDAWLATCRRDVAKDFMKVIAPFEIRVAVELLEDSDLPDLEVGNNYAKLGRWSEAIQRYRSAGEMAKSDGDLAPETQAKAFYNLGVALAYSGNYDAGIGQIEAAFALHPDERFLAEVERIRRFKADDARLAEQRAGRGES